MLFHLSHSSPAVSTQVLRNGAKTNNATQLPVAAVASTTFCWQDALTKQRARSPITQLPWQSEASGARPLAPASRPRAARPSKTCLSEVRAQAGGGAHPAAGSRAEYWRACCRVLQRPLLRLLPASSSAPRPQDCSQCDRLLPAVRGDLLHILRRSNRNRGVVSRAGKALNPPKSACKSRSISREICMTRTWAHSQETALQVIFRKHSTLRCSPALLQYRARGYTDIYSACSLLAKPPPWSRLQQAVQAHPRSAAPALPRMSLSAQKHLPRTQNSQGDAEPRKKALSSSKNPAPSPTHSRTGGTLYMPNQTHCITQGSRAACSRRAVEEVQSMHVQEPARSGAAARFSGPRTARCLLKVPGCAHLVSRDEPPLGAGRRHGDQAQQAA